jgi:hypothetical protein
VSLFYSAFGLSLKSNRRISGLQPIPPLPDVDVEVFWGGVPAWIRCFLELGAPPWYISSSCYQGQPILKVWRLAEGGYFWLRYWDGVEFVVDRAGSQIWAQYPPEANEEYLSSYLWGQVLGFLLRLRGFTCLHASAIAVGEHSLAITGPKGAGKSTTAAAFARLGYAVLSDDIVALRDDGRAFLVSPGGTLLCLWPKAVSYLYGSPDALPYLIPENSLDPGWDKRGLDLLSPEYHFQSHALPLGAVYFLSDRRACGPELEAISGRVGLLTLLANTYDSALGDKFLRAMDFKALSRLASQVPLCRVFPPSDPGYLTRVCEVILDNFHALPLSNSGNAST